MATRLLKPISRKVLIPLDNRIAPRPQDYATVTMYPAGYIGIRPHRSAMEYTVSLETIYRLGVAQAVNEGRYKRRLVKRGLLATERAA